MLLVEKVLMLKSSAIFHFTPEQELIDLAYIMNEQIMPIGTVLFEKGDEGDSLYMIYKGSVRIHDGDYTIAVLGESEIFGELSLLDAEPRSATATTLEECTLLELSQHPFYEVLQNNPTILKGIMKTLCQRLRATDKNATEISNLFQNK